jgi:predicted negative regulator of RcsB-dependent stress response
MGGISEALIATAVGILVAIPAVIAYNVFQKKCNDIEENTGALANQVLAVMKAKTSEPINQKANKKLIPMDELKEPKRSLREAEANS